MSLLNSYSSQNRVIEQDLAVSYTKERIHGSWTFETGVGVTTTYKTVWQYTRRATKLYRYVGMDHATAVSCANAMRNYFIRPIKSSEIGDGVQVEFTDIDAGNVPMATATAQYVEGQMWCTVISVDEIDTRLRLASVSPSSLFSVEDARQYDADVT